MKLRFTLIFLVIAFIAKSQLLTWSPEFIQETSSGVTVIADPAKGNQGLNSASPFDIYVHIGVITTASTSSSDWKYVPAGLNFNAPNPNYKATLLSSPTRHSFTFTGNLRTYFGITNANEHILKICILFRSGNGSNVLRNTDGSDMYVPVYDNGLHARIDVPLKQPKFVPVAETILLNAGDALPITGKASLASNMEIRLNGNLVQSAASVTTISATTTAVSGTNEVIVSATNGSVTKYDTVSFFVATPVINAPVPAGMRDGINYNSANHTTATLVLYAPFKTRVAIIGEFNNWTQTAAYQLNKDGDRWWITLTNLTPGQEYAFQYLIDGTLKVADMYCEKILDPWNDQYITNATYPGMKAYPSGQTGIVGILQTNKPAYNWAVTNFARPDKRNLVIYELLVRDFSAAQTFKTVKDSLPYLKKLGINALELMPVNEFEGNNSWGYNPDFFFATDKAYGTDNDLKALIDACHQNGIAVILDAVLNHATGLSPTAAMWWNSSTNKTAANNPYHNVDATHPFSVFHDFNHQAQPTKNLVYRFIEHWMVNYKVDGFRWDLSKGFTQTNSGGNVGLWGNYDQSRVDIWNDYYAKMKAIQNDSYCILEHLGDNSEETVLSNNGMMPWGNLNNDYMEGSMGFSSNLSWGVSDNRGHTNRHLVTYQESHDEERMMYKNVNFGNATQSPAYNVRTLTTALKRQELATAIFATQPGPKMIWQFGELGYDESRNRCPNGTVGTGDVCKTDPKPTHWEYLTVPARKNVYDVYSKLFNLRTFTAYKNAFISGTFTGNLAGMVKQQSLVHSSLSLVAVGNFDVVTQSTTVNFPATGVWYDYLNNNVTVNITTAGTSMTLAPGEYHVFLNQNAVAALPLKLISFKGSKTANANNLAWITTNEKNVKHFEIERSIDGNSFVKINTVNASNNASAQQNTYSLKDMEVAIINSNTTVYYRLKIVDVDGSVMYSSIVALQPGKNGGISIYPNPAKSGNVNINLGQNLRGNVQVKVIDVNGRTVTTALYNVSVTGNGLLPVNVSTLGNGVYNVQVIAANATATQRLIIQK